MSEHKPTARQGIKASRDHEIAQAVSPVPEFSARPSSQQAQLEDKVNATSAEGTLNPEASREVLPEDPTKPADMPFSEPDDAWADCSGLSHERTSFLREALAGYRSLLIGTRTRLQQELKNPSTLNPNATSTSESLRLVRLGIQKANVLLAELGIEDDEVPA